MIFNSDLSLQPILSFNTYTAKLSNAGHLSRATFDQDFRRLGVQLVEV